MGRSRAVSHFADDDHNQNRSKRKRTISSLENLETASTGQPLSDGKAALYHCNYFNIDILGMVRIKCAVCSDFDLCIECFSVGAEITPHKSNHLYRVMDNLSFPLICPDWNADEEILLLEGIEMYGFGNWTEVAKHVGTKSKSQCIDHYNAIYMKSPCFPLTDMSHVMGKSREELLAMAKEHREVKKELPAVGAKEDSPLSARMKSETLRKEGAACQSSSGLTTVEVGSDMPSSGNTFTGVKATNMTQMKDNIKVEGLMRGNAGRTSYWKEICYTRTILRGISLPKKEKYISDTMFSCGSTPKKIMRGCSRVLLRNIGLSKEYKNFRKHELMAVVHLLRHINFLNRRGKRKPKKMPKSVGK